MATPTENANAIDAFIQANYSSSPLGRFEAMCGAMRAMNELIVQASDNTYTRGNVFARRGLFTGALFEAGGWVDSMINSMMASSLSRSALVGCDKSGRPPRLIMLDGIYRAGTGGLFDPQDETGVTSWIFEEDEAGGAIVNTVRSDPNPAVRAAALRIIQDLALPTSWVTLFKEENVFAVLDEQIKSSPWDASTRRTLSALSAGAAGRIDTELAKLAAQQLPTFPVPTGNGQTVPTIPPAAKPWYKNGLVLATGVGGLLGGLALKIRRG